VCGRPSGLWGRQSSGPCRSHALRSFALDVRICPPAHHTHTQAVFWDFAWPLLGLGWPRTSKSAFIICRLSGSISNPPSGIFGFYFKGSAFCFFDFSAFSKWSLFLDF
jgi:hypothetical protein